MYESSMTRPPRGSMSLALKRELEWLLDGLPVGVSTGVSVHADAANARLTAANREIAERRFMSWTSWMLKIARRRREPPRTLH
jgi:hypothetical protein